MAPRYVVTEKVPAFVLETKSKYTKAVPKEWVLHDYWKTTEVPDVYVGWANA